MARSEKKSGRSIHSSWEAVKIARKVREGCWAKFRNAVFIYTLPICVLKLSDQTSLRNGRVLLFISGRELPLRTHVSLIISILAAINRSPCKFDPRAKQHGSRIHDQNKSSVR